MTSQQPFCKMEEKVFSIDFIEIFHSQMKRVYVNKGCRQKEGLNYS